MTAYAVGCCTTFRWEPVPRASGDEPVVATKRVKDRAHGKTGRLPCRQPTYRATKE